MKQSLQLKLGQQLTMTPQLQQAIRLLQLSSMELTMEVQQVLESNMMLELDEDGDLPDLGFETNIASPAAEQPDYEGESDTPEFEDWERETTTVEDIPTDMPTDSEWEDVFDSTLPQGAPSSSYDDDGGDRESRNQPTETLREHLLWQLNLLPLSPTDQMIAVAIVDALNADGYLEASLEELVELLNDPDGDEVTLEEVAAVLKQIQTLEPPGVAARDLRECLLLQLRQLPTDERRRDIAIRLCDDNLDVLAARDFTVLGRRLRATPDELRGAIALVQSLSPRPGSAFSERATEYIVPDVFVRKVKGRWRVELNQEVMPQLRINPYYAGMIKRADNSPDSNSLRNHLQEARWFIKSLQSRSDTLLRVANAIVERQRAFLEHGDEAMRPLVLHDIAETLGMHESTISRVTTRKYMHTPRGTFELKYFFSSHVGTSLGGEASSTAIRAVIRKLIAAESAAKPLSDSKIASILLKQGINVARRTVAKYREGMQIPPSNERKQLV